jgi:hypothetical protein
MVKAESTAVSVHTNKEYRGTEVQLYSFLSLAVDRIKLSASYVSCGGNNHQYLLNGRLGWPQEQFG